MVNIPTSLINLKAKVDNLDVLKIFPIDLKKLVNLVDNDVVKNTTFNTLNTKTNNIKKKKIPIQVL